MAFEKAVNGLILAAGKGSRMDPGHIGICKPLIEVAGKPLITYSLDRLIRLGIRKTRIVVSAGENRIEQALGSRYETLEIEYVHQEHPSGIVSSILSAGLFLEQDFVLQLCDEIFFHSDFSEEIFDEAKGFDYFVVCTRDRAEKIRLNFSVEMEEDGRILRCVEKPTEVVNDLKGTGFCYFSGECGALLRERAGRKEECPVELVDFFNLLTAEGKKGMALVAAGEEINLNTPEDLLYAQEKLSGSGRRAE